MDGVVVVDKPPHLTSHDVVAAARRALKERRIGHTGTLDPIATGVLPLVCGRATRLARFLTASDKEYDATILFGVTTDTFDVTGRETARSHHYPDRDAVERALAALTGSYLQVPPAYSAKKIAGERAYAIARRDQTVGLPPVPVTVERATLVDFDGRAARIALTCSAGFYVRAFAHALGELTAAGGCLEALRRTRSGEFGLEQSVPLADLMNDPATAGAFTVPLDRLLGSFPAVHLGGDECRRVAHGQPLRREVAGRQAFGEEWVRLLDGEGRLVAMATRGPGGASLHPAIVLI